MGLALAIVGWTLFGLAIVVGLVLDLAGLFGNWIILLAVVMAAAVSGFAYFSWWTIAILFGLAILGEILEATASGMGAAKFGGGRGAVVAAIVGCFVGALAGTAILPIIGTVLGAALGAFAGATLYEFVQGGKSLEHATRVGIGAALGKVAGLFAKTFVGFAMLLVAAITF